MNSDFPWILADASMIYLDLFPAKVVTRELSLGEVFRVIVTDGHFYLLDEGEFGPIAKIAEPLISIDGSNKLGYTVTTTNNVYAISRATNCGCGSRLRGIHPFAGVPYVPMKG